MTPTDTYRTGPYIRIDKLHIRGLRGLTAVNLPEDGLGWDVSGIPDVVVIAGANGSGKTTLLRCIAGAAHLLVSDPTAESGEIPNDVDASECLIDFGLNDGVGDPRVVRFVVGDNQFVNTHRTGDSFGYSRREPVPRATRSGFGDTLRKALESSKRFIASAWPRVVFFPSEERDLVVPAVDYKAPGSMTDKSGFVTTWKRPKQGQWGGSTMELLFSARWADLNAKEEGHPELATHFDSYTRAFNDLTGNKKRLVWTPTGDLVVQIEDGTTHLIQDLSAGERQALLLLAELRRLWRPGSLVMIDELELHFHDSWQARLLDVLRNMQKELGGQVIVTTQSHSLFSMADLGTRLLLGRGNLR